MLRKFTLLASILGSALVGLGAIGAAPESETAQQKHDRLLVAVQSICPVSGEKLGAHGAPVKTEFGESKENLFVCCKSCVGEEADAAHLATIHGRMVAAQGVCLVMNKPVDADSDSAVVSGQRYFLCCPPCEEKIQADLAAYQAKLDAAYESFLKQQK
jgi:hypothetical protein